MNGHTGKLVRNTILYLPAQFLPPLVQFTTMIAWTHLLPPAGFGVVTFVIAAQEFTALVGITWWTLFVLRFRSRFTAAGEERFRLLDSLVVACATVAQLVLTLPMLWLAGAPIGWAIVLASAAFFVARTIFAHYGEWARGGHLIGLFTISQLIAAVIGSGLSIAALIMLGPVPAAALAAQAFGYALALGVLFTKMNLRLRPGAYDRAIFADARTYGAPLILSGVLGWIAGNSIRVIVQLSEGAFGLGLLSVGWGLGQRIAAVLAMLFTAATYPLAVTNMEGGDRNGALAQVSLNGVFLLALLTPAMAGVALISSPLVTIMIAAQFREMTIVILPIAILAAAIRALRIHTSDQTMILVERTHATMFANMFEASANIVLGAAGLYLGGIVGATLGVLAGTAAAAVASFAYAFLRLGLPAPSGWTIMRILLATAVMSETVHLLPAPGTLVALATTVTVAAVTYAAAIVLAFPKCRAAIATLAMRRRGVRKNREA